MSGVLMLYLGLLLIGEVCVCDISHSSGIDRRLMRHAARDLRPGRYQVPVPDFPFSPPPPPRRFSIDGATWIVIAALLLLLIAVALYFLV